MGKYERNPETQDEMIDDELRGVGVKFRDRTKDIPENAEYEPVAEDAKKPAKLRWVNKILGALASLVAVDGLLIFMCLADKIELSYGLVALAASSAFLGGKVNHARL